MQEIFNHGLEGQEDHTQLAEDLDTICEFLRKQSLFTK